MQKHYYLCNRHRKWRGRYNCKQFHHIWWTTSRNCNIRNDRFVIDKNQFFLLSRAMTSTLPNCRRFKNVTGVSGNKVFWLQKDSAFQFPKPCIGYFIARPHFISNRTQIYWNCFLRTIARYLQVLFCIKSMKSLTTLFEFSNSMWSIA